MAIESAIELKNKHIPKSLFKYRTFDSDSNALRNLEKDTVWLADPSTFNDPYDCVHTFQVERLMNFDKINQLKAAVFQSLAEDKKAEIEAAITQTLNEEFSDIIRQTTKSIASSFKLCSFSERLDSTLMWAHYADYHQGFCVEYDFACLPDTDLQKRFLYPVIYTDTLLNATEFYSKSLNGEKANNLFLSCAALCKAKDWSYESEWRLIFANATLESAQSYPVPKPKAVYLGAKVDEHNKRELIEICDSKCIPVFEMCLDQTRFKLKPIPYR